MYWKKEMEAALLMPPDDTLSSDELKDFYDEYGAQLFVCALAVTRCRDMAEDAVQEGFIRLFRMKNRPRSLKSYAFRTIRNAAIDLNGDGDIDLWFQDEMDVEADPPSRRRCAKKICKPIITKNGDHRRMNVCDMDRQTLK